VCLVCAAFPRTGRAPPPVAPRAHTAHTRTPRVRHLDPAARPSWARCGAVQLFPRADPPESARLGCPVVLFAVIFEVRPYRDSRTATWRRRRREPGRQVADGDPSRAPPDRPHVPSRRSFGSAAGQPWRRRRRLPRRHRLRRYAAGWATALSPFCRPGGDRHGGGVPLREQVRVWLVCASRRSSRRPTHTSHTRTPPARPAHRPRRAWWRWWVRCGSVIPEATFARPRHPRGPRGPPGHDPRISAPPSPPPCHRDRRNGTASLMPSRSPPAGHASCHSGANVIVRATAKASPVMPLAKRSSRVNRRLRPPTWSWFVGLAALGLDEPRYRERYHRQHRPSASLAWRL
jgi:hypothetical protein